MKSKRKHGAFSVLEKNVIVQGLYHSVHFEQTPVELFFLVFRQKQPS